MELSRQCARPASRRDTHGRIGPCQAHRQRRGPGVTFHPHSPLRARPRSGWLLLGGCDRRLGQAGPFGRRNPGRQEHRRVRFMVERRPPSIRYSGASPQAQYRGAKASSGARSPHLRPGNDLGNWQHRLRRAAESALEPSWYEAGCRHRPGQTRRDTTEIAANARRHRDSRRETRRQSREPIDAPGHRLDRPS